MVVTECHLTCIPLTFGMVIDAAGKLNCISTLLLNKIQLVDGLYNSVVVFSWLRNITESHLSSKIKLVKKQQETHETVEKLN